MERVEYDRLAAHDRVMWWFRGLHAVILGALSRAGHPGIDALGIDAPLLDAGCGAGGLLAALAGALPTADPLGLELDCGAAAQARRASGCPVCVGSVNALPFATDCLGAIVSADVLCHRGVDETAALGHFHRCLKPGGTLVLNLPAYRWLLSDHDRAVDNVRRYTAAGLGALLKAAGFVRVRTSYWNTVLFPLMVLRRKLWRRRGKTPVSDVALLPAPIEALFRAIATGEARLLRTGVRLPFGGSVLATAMKPAGGA
jgi:SAM-dependent methyltransferase